MEKNILPSVGILLFILLYIWASTLYPGGNQLEASHQGFDWIHNYWCNLTKEIAINGESNSARPYALTAMLILCFSIWLFFIQFAMLFAKNEHSKKVILIFGTLSMALASLVFTRFHDIMIISASVAGLFALMAISWEIYGSKLYLLKFFGIFNLLLIAFNNIIYYSGSYLVILPLLQKITFLTVLIWIITINYRIARSSLLSS